MSFALVLAVALPFGAPAADVEPTSTSIPALAAPASAAPDAGALHDRLLALDRAIRHVRRRLERDDAPPPRTAPGAPPESERLRSALDRLGSAVAALPDESERQDLTRKLRQLRLLATDLGRLEDGRPAPAADRRGRAPRWVVTGDHSSCSSALPLTAGDAVAGDTAERAGGEPAGEVWFRVTSGEGGWLTLDTRGSDFDTTLAVFGRCPGAGTVPLAEGDDSYGLTAGLVVTLDTGAERWVRLGSYGDGGGRFELVAASFGVIAGTVTRFSDGSPVGGWVDVYDSGGTYAGSDDLEGGIYAVPGLATGAYFVRTNNWDGWIDEVYDDVPCNGCDPTIGDPVAVQEGQLTPDVDFVLSTGGAISGRVRDASSGLPVTSGSVIITGPAGQWVRSGYLDAAGRWRVGGLAPGSYRAYTDTSTHSDEVYDDLPCSPSCSPAAGTPIQVVTDQTTRDVDFALQKLGEISGTVTSTDGGVPIASAEIEVWNDGFYDYDYTDGQGRYSIGGLAAGTYMAKVRVFGYRNEVWDDIPCAGPYDCDTSGATPIVVAANATVSGIDFALDPAGGISGRVAFEGDDTPVGGAEIRVWTPAGDWVDSGYSDTAGQGHYTVSNLYPGSYRVGVIDDNVLPRGFLDEIYDDMPCEVSCDPTTGTPVPVGPGATTTGIDFAVSALGWIEGTVTDAVSGAPVAGVQIDVYYSFGPHVPYVFAILSDSSGHYVTRPLPPGNFFLVAGSSTHLDELYDDLPCDPDCDPTTGTPVAVALGTATTGIDFGLDERGSFSGMVTDAATGEPLYATIEIWSAAGDYLGQLGTAGNGSFHTDGLGSGSYHVVAVTYTHRDELYDDLPCPDGGWLGCDPTTGTPIVVTQGVETSGIDFALDPLGAIAGRVTDATTGGPIGSGSVEVYDSSGDWSGDGFLAADGTYAVGGLEPGIYFARSDVYYDYANELYDDLPCLYPCDPTTGTPIAVSLGATTGGIDFALEPTGGIAGRVTDTAGRPLAGVAIDFWESDGYHAGAAATDGEGRYSQSLYSTTFFVSTDNGLGGLDEVYDDVPCPLGPAYDGLCDPTAGTPVAVDSSLPFVRGIDFSISGVPLFADGFESGDLSAWSAPGLTSRSAARRLPGGGR